MTGARRFSPRFEALEDRTLMSTCTVTRLSDTGIGGPRRGTGDLRFCINLANTKPGPDSIEIHPTGTINVTGALPSLSDDVKIVGPGAELLTVRRNTGGDYGVFTVNSGVSAEIYNITISNGFAEFGGGVHNVGSLILADVAVTLNTGKGISAGGAIYNSGNLTILTSSIAENIAFRGGAIYSEGTITIRDTTIRDNTAAVTGGGIYGGGNLTIVNSTVSRNSSQEQGGGMYLLPGAKLTLRHSTVSGNTSDWGGGIINAKAGSENHFRNSTVAGNSAATFPDFKGWLNTSGYNIFGNSSGGLNQSATDMLDVDPMLGPLADNGGPTLTHALLPGSPAIDAGDNSDAPEFDQRGPGFPRIVNGTIDIGAFEVQATRAPGMTNDLAVLLTADLDDFPFKARRLH